jgi:tetratricopeptide (TPR) repeat protein
MSSVNPNAGSVFGPAMADVWGVTTKKRKRKQAQRDERIQSDYEARHGAPRTNAKSLHPEVAAVAGEAHGALIVGNRDRAIQLFGEVVRRAPDHPDAYATLSEVFEARSDEGDLEKALQLALVAAHLQTEDPEGWRRVAILALDSNDDGTAKDALDRVLRMDPSDCAALGDLAQLLGRMGKHAEAADRCDSFLSQRDDVTPEVTSLYLVLAEHCSQSERYDEAKKALKRALDDANRLVANGDVDARETKERAAVELARLKLRENDIDGARQLLGEASANEPLDVSVLRGCCDRDASKWAPLIPHLRRVSTEIGQGNEASCRAHERLAVLVECCSSCAGDDQEDVVRALLDGAARCAAARGSLKRPDAALWRRKESDAHASLSNRFLQRGSLYAASQRAERALKADATHVPALRAFVECVNRGASVRLEAVAQPFARLARSTKTASNELEAWVAYAAALEAALEVASGNATLLAIASARVATKLRRVATQQPLAIAAMTVACGEDPLLALSAALAKCGRDAADVFRRVERLCKTDEEVSIEGTLKQCGNALDCTDTADRVVRAMACVEKLGFVLFEGDELASLVSARSMNIEDGMNMDLARATLQTGKAPRDAAIVETLRQALTKAEELDMVSSVECVDDALSDLCRRVQSPPITALVQSRQRCQPRKSTTPMEESSSSDSDEAPVQKRAPCMKTCPGCSTKLHNCVKTCNTCGTTFGARPRQPVESSDDDMPPPRQEDSSSSSEGEACVPRSRVYFESSSSSSSSSEEEIIIRPSRFGRQRQKTQRLSDMMGGRGKSYDEPRDMAGRRLPSSSEDESSSDDDSEPRRKRYVEKPHHRAGKAPSKVCPKCQTRMHSCKKKCPTCGECFGTAKAGGAHAERWKHIQSHASGNTEADVMILRVEELRERLESRGLSSEGLKKELQARLLAEYRKPPGDPAADAAAAAAAADARRAAPAPSRKPAAAPRKKPAPAPVSGRKKQTIAPRKAPKKKNDGAACAPRRAAKPLVGGEDARSLIERAAPISVLTPRPTETTLRLQLPTPLARHRRDIYPSPVASSAGASGQPEEGRLGAAVCQVHGRDHCQGVY